MAGDFSDDEWDISDDQWHVLEHDAILSTQQQRLQSDRNGGRSATVSGQRLGQSSRETLGSSSLRRAAPASRLQQQYAQPLTNGRNDSFDNPQLDEDGVPLVVEEQPRAYLPPRRIDETTEREQWRVNRFAQKHGPQIQTQPRPRAGVIPRQAYEEYQQRQNGQSGRQVLPPAEQPKQQVAQTSTDAFPELEPKIDQTHLEINSNQNEESIQAQLAQLKKEKDLLAQNLNVVQSELYTAKGEISVIRGKTRNEQKTAERQLEVLRKQLQEEANKHQAVVLSKDAAYGKLVTDNNFLKHELDEQARRVQTLQRQAKDKPLQDRLNDVNLSPRKGIANSLRDGFNDDEVMQMSPGRSPARRRTSKPNTPTKKRKHPTTADIDMPTLALRLTGERPQAEQTKPDAERHAMPKVVQDYKSRAHLQLLQDLLAFRLSTNQETIVESLIKHAYPSDPSHTLSSILLVETSKLKGERLPGDLLNIFVIFLQRCLKEGYFKPLGVLLEAINHIFDLDPTIVDAQVINTIVSPLQNLAIINAKTRWTYFTQRQKLWNQQIPKPVYKEDVSTAACLELLITIAGLVVDDTPLLRLFWRVIQTDTVLLLLASVHPIPELTLMLELMETSIFSETIGVLCTEADQSRMEMYIIDKACYLLWEPPRHVIKTYQEKRVEKTEREKRQGSSFKSQPVQPDPDELAPSRLQLCQFHFKVLAFLSKIAIGSSPHPHHSALSTNHGTNAMLQHPPAVPRLIRFLYDQVNSLYANNPDTHNHHAQLINRATAILHHLLLSPQAIGKDSKFDLIKALSSVKAGVHHFRVALARITFREAMEHVGVDLGITEETVQRANEILEEYVTPDEALQLLAAFGKDEEDDDDEEAEARAEAQVMADVER